MRIKLRFPAEQRQPSMIIELPFPPRPGDTVDLGYDRSGEVLTVIRSENEKRYEAIIRVREIRKVRSLG